ncbi:MAG: type II toxin-antitoxin system RelE/ParE family toxin [Terracidiphilus sp.]|jgi:mRNA-degrading endonuclease RelE of RelBE toxin-antitoxin system
MSWVVDLSAPAIKALKKLPRDRQLQVAQAIDEMEIDPLAGDVKSLKGPEWKDHYRKRVGVYRLIFTLDRKAAAVAISAILIRSEKTYR